MKVVSYISKFLESKGIDTIFELQGGMITRIIDEMYRQGGFNIVSMHHEQAAAMAADAYARIRNIPGVALATSGPGATNLVTGIGNCYFDSVPAIFITGQVNLNEQKGDRPIRQLGFQETDIVSIVQPITKAAYAVKRAQDIPEILEAAFKISMEGRPGPVLIDIPMNIQNEECSEFKNSCNNSNQTTDNKEIDIFSKKIIAAINASKKPLILVGRGVRSSNSLDNLQKLLSDTNIPIVSSLNGLDAIPYNLAQRVGFIGSYGNRWANYALGTCDLLIVLGSRLDLRQTGADINAFTNGKIIFHIDIEKDELNNRVLNCETLHANLKDFFYSISTKEIKKSDYKDWYTEINKQKLLQADTDELKNIQGINPNKFVHALSQSSKQAKVFTVDVGSNQMWVSQSIELNEKQIFITSGGMGAMGYSLPAAIGACFASNKSPVVSISGDGGFQINSQELQTIKSNNLPIKIIIINNQCLGMIRQFQDSYFESNYASTVWGYSAPDFVALANAYKIRGSKIENEADIENGLKKLWENPLEPYLLEVMVDIHTNVYPKMLFGKPLTDMEGE